MLLGDLSSSVVTEVTSPDPLAVRVYREPFTDQFTLVIPNGDQPPYSDLMDVEQTRKWFTTRGCDAIKLEKALDYAWEFGFYRPCFVKVKTLTVYTPYTKVTPRL